MKNNNIKSSPRVRLVSIGAGLSAVAFLLCGNVAHAGPTAPVVAQNPASVTAIIDSYSSFTVSFTGTAPITNQWEISWNAGLTFTNLPAQTNSTLLVTNLALVTNVYVCVASNSAGHIASAPATNTVVSPPPLRLAGDLVVELRSMDLANGYNSPGAGGVYTNTVWTNHAGVATSVGNFARNSNGALSVSNSTVNPGTPLWGPVSVNALYVDSVSLAAQSASFAPAEISTNGASSGEAWIYATVLSGNNSVISYGLQGGSGNPEEDREMNWGTASGCFSGDFGSLDCKWASPNPVTGAWEYLVWTWDGTNAIGYLNGVLNVKNTLSKSTTFNGYPIQTIDTVIGVGAALGNNPNAIGVDAFAGGWIASVRLSSGVLTASQVSNNFQAGLLAAEPIIPSQVTLSPTNTQVTVGNSTTLTAVYTSVYPVTYQWRSSTNGGITWNVIAGATNTAYVLNTTGFAPGNYEYEVVFGNSAYSLIVTSSPVTLTLSAPSPPVLVQDTTPRAITNYVTTTNTFTALFAGEAPLTFQWQVSNSASGAWTAITGATTTALAVASPVPLTNWYRLQAVNPLAPDGVTSDPAELIVLPAPPLPPYRALQVAGDLIVNLQEVDLSTNTATWTNFTASTNAVGNFTTVGGASLNVTSYGAPYLYHNLNTLSIAGNSQNVLQSALLAPLEIIGNNPVSAEAWIYATGVNQQNSCFIGYGVQAQNNPPQTDREFNYNTGGHGAVSGDFGNYDTGWAAGTVAPGVWHYLAMSYDGVNLNLYMDGTNNNINVISPANDTYDTLVGIGGGVAGFGPGWTDVFQGYIAAARLESGVLTAAQVSNNFAAGPLGVVPVLLSAPSLTPSQNTVYQGVGVTFGLVDSRESVPFAYQWQTDGGSGGVTWSGIPGATGSNYVLNTATLNAGTYQYEIVLTNSAYSFSVTSAPVTLTVLSATAPPAVLQVFNLGPTNVVIVFSNPVTAASADNPSNYAFTNGLPIASASLAPDDVTVTLGTAALAYYSNYWIVINGILSGAPTAVMIPTNTLVYFGASPFATQDIGAPSIPSTSAVSSQGVIVTAAGAGIDGSADQFNYQYQIISGNFDVSVSLASLGLSDLWAEAGLMARASLEAGSPFAAALATPGMVGDFFADRTATNGTAVTAGSFPVNYPNTWLRLNRMGNVFTGFGSYDGTNWTPLGGATITMPSQIYLGLAVASHNTNEATTAQFVDYENTPTNAVVSTLVNPNEPLGPSSRKTGIVISEIMYKPAPRSDGNNVEFLEIYNSCPFFQDISSYTVTCADMNYTFPANTLIPAGAFFVLAASPQGIANVYGLTSNVFGPYNGSLKHSETLEVLDEQSNVLLTVPYTDVYPWPTAADGTGHSLVLANPTYGEGDARAWAISDAVGGSPGQADPFTPSPLRSVVINEILPHTENPAVPQFIELYNHSTNSVDVSGCILTDDPATNEFVIPTGTVIGPAGFVAFTQSQFGFTLNGEGETLYFIKPDGSRVLDAVQFGAQADGVSYGRWPDGANDFYAFTTNTPGTNNSAIVIGDIVINELMYDPISGNDDDQYIELYNKGTNAINLSGWEFTAGVTFTFPPNVIIGPNGYVVVGKNSANLLANYTNLNSGNTYGNYSGKLSHDGELVVLSQPESYFGTNTIYVEEDEVTYGTGGRWGEWSAAGGSSLELIDPHSNHRLAANWADSDETQKSSWVDIENTGVLDNGANYDPSIDYAQMGLLDAGECLVDNIEVDYNGSNYVSNGTFESGLGLNDWSLQGCLACSSLENSGYQSSYSLHIRCSDKIWTGDNSCEVALKANSMVGGRTATLRFKARWLRGWPEVLLRLNGNWLEATAAMPVPANLGTPGAPNSQYVTNAGPAMYNVTHTPSLPAANQAVVVTANVHDPDGIQSLTLYYRLDPATTYIAMPMNDNGANGDAIAGDGVFSATIPGQAANQIVAFYISATDNLGASTRFPALRTNDNVPAPECVVMFGDGNPAGSFGVYHLWITQTNVTRWANLGNLSRDWENDCTFVNGSRVIYNMQGRFSGSPYHQSYDTPAGALCNYEWKFNADDMLLGATDFKKIHQPGAEPGVDPTIQASELAFTFHRALGVSWLYKRYVAVYVNGNRRGTLMEDTQVPNGDVVKEHFPNDTDGFLFKMQPWFELAPFLSGYDLGFDNQSWCNVMPYTTTGGVKKVPRYRYCFEIRRTPDSDSDFTNVFSLVDAASSYGTPNYVANLENMANMENWMRVFAADHAAGCWDSFGSQNGQNLYGYIGALGTKYTLMMWDLETVFGQNGGWAPGQDLLTVNGEDPNMQNIYNTPAFLRMYWRALQILVNGPLNVANSEPLLMAKFNAFTDNGLSVQSPAASLEPWLAEAQSSIAAQLAAVNATNFSVNPTVTLSNNVASISGGAPVDVDFVWINGVAYPLTWTSLTNWTVTLALTNGTNPLSIVGVDDTGQPIAGDSNQTSVNYSGTIPSPVGQVAINEIMWNPSVTNAQYVELVNNSTNITYDLSGWQLQGLSYTFPSGALLPPLGFLVLAANAPAFAAAYGATNLVFDTFDGTLSPGQLLSLEQPGGGSNLVVAQVQFDDVLPWPTNANNPGVSLQLVDPHQDNWRVGNWSTGQTNPPPLAFTPDASNSVAASLPPFPPLWINEVEPDNLTGLTNSAGQHAPWLELYNPTTNTVALTGLCLSSTYANLTNWVFPSGAAISPGQFLVVFADGQTNLTTLSQLHTSFALSGSNGSVALSRVFNGQPQVLDYVNYTNLPPNWSYGSLPDGQSFVRVQFYSPTPGAPNNNSGTPPASFVAYNTDGFIYTQSFDSLPDPGATSVNTANPVTIDGVTYSLPNPFDFALPVSATGNTGGLGLAATMPGWYGLADSTASVGVRFGATDGDQTTGGQISFGLPDSSNRALGLLATSTTGYTAIGAKFINNTGTTLNYINLQVTGEIWRQSNLPKTLECYYLIDPTATAAMSTQATAFLPAFNVSFPTDGGDVGGAAVDGTAPTDQINLSVTNQSITNWPAGAALWLVWEMADDTGKAQGLAIDNMSFAATALGTPTNTPVLSVGGSTGNPFVISWAAPSTGYQLYSATNLAPPVVWSLVATAAIESNGALFLTIPPTNATAQFFRLMAR